MTAILDDLSPAALAEANEANMCASYATFGRWPGAEWHETPAAMACITGLPHPLFNGVFRPRLSPGDAGQAIEQVMAPFKRREAPAYWWVGPAATPDDLGARLEAHGLPYDGDVPGMAVDLHALPETGQLSLPVGLAMARVAEQAGIEECGRVLSAAFHMPEAVSAAYMAGFGGQLLSADARGSAWRLYLATMEGAPVATASLFLGAGVAGVYAVGTVPAARRRGIGAALVVAALREAAALGYRAGVLQASEMGFPVYERLGFRQCCTYRHYVWEA